MNPISKLRLISVLAGALTIFFGLSLTVETREYGYDESVANIQQQPNRVTKTISFELWRNRVYLPTSVNGSKPFPFILDTGASSTTLSQQLAGELNLKLKNQRQERGGRSRRRLY